MSGAAVSCLMWVLRIELESSEELCVFLTTEQSPTNFICNIVNTDRTLKML